MIRHQLHPVRTARYLKKYTFENARGNALLFLAIAAFLVLWLGVYLNFTNPFLFREGAQVAYYFITLFLAGCLSSGMLFSDLGSKPKAISYLLLPASTLEKFLVTMLYGVFVFFVVCSGIFWAIDFVVVSFANYKYDTHWQVINLFTLNEYPNPFFDGSLTDIFFMYFPLQALFILCSISFDKHGIFKAIVGVGLLWVIFIAVFLVVQSLLPVGVLHDMGTYEVIEANGDNKLIVLPVWLTAFISVSFKFLLTPMLWSAAFFKLKEKQI